MKKLFLLAVLALSISCKKEEKSIVPPKPIAVEAPVSHECYQGVLGKDTISMSLQLKGSEVTSGKLHYKFFEKDSNEGELVGSIKGDTLFATYTFISEGAGSVREVAFLKKGNTYVEGYGDINDDQNGNITFKDVRRLKFDSKTVLSKVACQHD